jgi:CheY-specific phosphatase CheX
VKEAANMICGDFLSKLDQTEVFDLSIPIFIRRPRGFREGNKAYSVSFDSETGVFGAVLSLSE